MQAVVVANGELISGYEDPVLAVMAAADVVIAADGGLRHCAALNVWPTTLVGDLDSAPDSLVDEARERGVRILAFPADKNATDLELALHEAISLGADHIVVVAGFGGRLDHEVATLGLLASEQWQNVDITATDGRRSVWVTRSNTELSLPAGQSVSLIPWAGSARGVTTVGLQWPLVGEELASGSTRGVSNVATGETQSVSIESGVLLVVSDCEN